MTTLHSGRAGFQVPQSVLNISAFRAPTKALLKTAESTLANLPDLDLCFDRAHLERNRHVAPPPEERALVSRLERELGEIVLQRMRVELPRALELCDMALETARELEYPDIRIQLAAECSGIMRAQMLAVATGRYVDAAYVGSRWLFQYGYGVGGRTMDVSELAAGIESRIRRAGMQDTRAAWETQNAVAAMLAVTGRSHEAAREFDAVLEFAERTFGPSDPLTQASLSNVGAIAVDTGVDLERVHRDSLRSMTMLEAADQRYSGHGFTTRGNIVLLALSLGLRDTGLVVSSASFWRTLPDSLPSEMTVNLEHCELEHAWSTRDLNELVSPRTRPSCLRDK